MIRIKTDVAALSEVSKVVEPKNPDKYIHITKYFTVNVGPVLFILINEWVLFKTFSKISSKAQYLQQD